MGFEKTFEHMMELWITPEIEKRQKENLIEKPYKLDAAQVIFFPDSRKPLILLNREIKAITKVKLKKGITKEKGDPIYENEIDGIHSIKIPAEVDPDSGHITAIRIQDKWILSFDFIYNKEFSQKHIINGNQFLELAKIALSSKYWGAFIDNLFSAAELYVKALLLFHPDPKLRNKDTHKLIHNRYNKFANLGNVPIEQKNVFNKLTSARRDARYLKSEFHITEEEANYYLNIVDDMKIEAEKHLINKES
ncbi:MAG: HEPN domain-containing protein [Calditrichaceae bacterium]